MPDTPSDIREKNEKLPKKGGTLDKYKWWLIGGLAVIAIAVFYFTSQSNQNAQSSNTSATQPGIDPNTGLPYASEMGMGGMGGFPFFGMGGGGGRGARGPAGPAGKPGPRGKRGPPGKPPKKKHHHHDKHGNPGNMSSLGALRAYGGNKMNPAARAAHNQRIVPAGMRTGPGM